VKIDLFTGIRNKNGELIQLAVNYSWETAQQTRRTLLVWHHRERKLLPRPANPIPPNSLSSLEQSHCIQGLRR